MKNIRREVAVWVQFVTFILLWVAVLYLSRVEYRIGWEALRKIPEVIALYSVLHVIFTGWAWKFPMFQGWLVPYPNLQGTWTGIVESTWLDPASGQPKPPIPIVFVIKQSFYSVSCVMVSEESPSYSNTAQISTEEASGILQLSYNYTNRPKATIRDRSEIHDGAAILRVILKPKRMLEGDYWTSRKTTGDIRLVFESRKLTASFVHRNH